MSVQAIGTPMRVAAPLTRLRLEHVVMGGAIICLIVLVVLPLLSLLFGSLRGETGLSLGNFSEVVTGRLYVSALKNSLILGAWTGLFSMIIGVVLAWAVSRTDVPGKALIQLTASLAYLSPPFLTAIAFVYLFSPNAGLINVLMRDELGIPWLTFNVFSMSGLVLVTVLHTFPFVYLLASSALLSVDASYEEAAQILGASKLRTAFTVTAPLVAPAILSGTLLAFVHCIALFGSQAILGLRPHRHAADAHLRLIHYLRNTARLRAVAGLILITVAALYLQRIPQALLCDAWPAGFAAADHAARRPLDGVRLLVFFVSIVLPMPPDRRVVLEVMGAGFWKNLTIATTSSSCSNTTSPSAPS
jgi:iron(III) transport system permease protein